MYRTKTTRGAAAIPKLCLTFLLLASTAVMPLLLTACGAQTDPGSAASATESTTAAETEPEDTRVYPDIPDADYGGAEFNVLQFDNGNDLHILFEFYVAEENGEILNDTLYQRNLRIEEKYNVVIGAVGSKSPANDVRNLVTAGDCPYSVVADWPTNLAAVSSSGAFANALEMPYMDLSMPWWNENANRAYSIAGKQFLLSGDYVLYEKQRLLVFFYNHDLADDYALPPIYDKVYAGEWTVDLMNEYAGIVQSDLNGDGQFTIPDDRYGLVSGSNTYIPYLLFGLGNSLSVKNADGSYSLGISTDRMLQSMEKLGKTMYQDYTCYWEDISKFYKGAKDVFAEGRGLFFHEVLQVARTMDTDIHYGIIPQPKFDEAQEQYLTGSQYSFSDAIAIPLTVDREMTGLLLEALSADSRYSTLPALVETVLQVKKAPDAESVDMINICFSNIVHDLFGAFQIGKVDSLVVNAMYKDHGEGYLSKVAAQEESIMNAYQQLEDAYAGL